MTRKSMTAFVALAAVALLFTACKTKPGETAPASSSETATAPGETAPEGFALVDSSRFNVADYKGKVLLLDFWATWCGPCKMEIPHLIELNEKYRDRGLVVVGVTFDDDPDSCVPAYAAEAGMNYLNVRGTDKMKAEYKIMGLPTLVIYDRAGKIVMNRPGYVEAKVLEDTITPLL
jgi:thiol-disulfide isomerase/thioredoxin